jgi:GH18 family chitinase
MGIYTHLNYAFATIDPKTFEVLPGSDYEKKLMTRLTDLKKIDPDLKVFVAVGGWTFNDPGATQKVFSDLASSESNQRKFFKSLSSFLSTYNFDGIDLDWEYPVADDRGGRTSDFKNFPKFMANLKTAMKSWGGRDGLSITLPASYWYLQHFDIANLQKHVDFFNIMTYDIHGKWDLGNEWLAPVLNSHTNLTEITIAMDLLWRNDIKPEKVVMGLAFYARVFAAADISCMDAGCPFASGGNPGKCSNEVSILLNSEIMDIMDKQKLQSTLDKKAAVKILKFDDNQWLTYDNQETFQLKADFARSQCLGGVMVWAVSHDLPSGNFSRVLGEVIGREVTSLQYDKTKDSLKVTKNHLQCRWSNCGDDCPSGWSRIRRTDKGARGGEHMWDNTGCAEGQHTFCCPPDAELPKCGWYTHNNGNCDSECPSGYVEVGSNFQHCSNNKNDYQAACCTTDTSSMKLYSQCDWAGDAPKCGKGQCKDSQSVVALSTTGSGGNYCNPSSVTYTLTGQDATYEERKYCCDQDDNVKWSDCQWYDALGISESVFQVIGFCDNNCPSDRVRVALDQHGGDCKGDGGRAKCCIAKYSTVSKRSYTDSESQMESNLKDFMDDPRCGLDDYSFKRDLAGMDLSSGNISFSGDTHSISNLRRRASTKSMDVVLSMAYSIYITYDATAAIQEMWQRNVVSVYTHLTVETVRAFMLTAEDYYSRGSWNFVLDLVCNMGFMNARVGDIDPIRCDCDTPDCCDPNDSDSCAEDADADFITKRQLEKRARNNEVELNDGNGNIVIVSWPVRCWFFFTLYGIRSF